MTPQNGSSPSTPEIRSHLICVLVENNFGVLSRISGLFASRGFNIDSLAVGATHDPSCSRITLVVRGDDRAIEQVHKQLNKLVDVIKVQDMTATGNFIDRELVMVKVSCTASKRSELVELANLFKAKTLDLSNETITLEIVGHQDKLEAFLEMLAPYGLLEVARTGRIALSRGPGGLQSSFVRTYKAHQTKEYQSVI